MTDLLPMLKAPFTLITGSEDVTLPNQTDLRWRPYNAAERAAISSILEHPLLVRWHAENLDDAAHPKLHPLPLGLVFPDGAPERGVPIPETPSLSIRDNRVLCAHRIRDGAQWAQRVQATTLAKQQWRAWTTVLEEEIGEAEFDDLLREHAFVLCVAGGGLDPSPKAWRALLNGAIPIIRRSPLLDAYSRLPVVVVDDWAEGCITPARLRAWKTHYELGAMRPNNRGALIEKLSLDYWWDVIVTDR
ncbi:MAG: hypothetical protein KIS81_07755 [Maricaulaceae bacterium]|nr:hypothetical protein [Maricaulaceae bacterium]